MFVNDNSWVVYFVEVMFYCGQGQIVSGLCEYFVIGGVSVDMKLGKILIIGFIYKVNVL